MYNWQQDQRLVVIVGKHNKDKCSLFLHLTVSLQATTGSVWCEVCLICTPLCAGFLDWVPKKMQRVGCMELLNTVQRRVKPKLHVFGHIHEGLCINTQHWYNNRAFEHIHLHTVGKKHFDNKSTWKKSISIHREVEKCFLFSPNIFFSLTYLLYDS